jgi:hypothetical protein
LNYPINRFILSLPFYILSGITIISLNVPSNKSYYWNPFFKYKNKLLFEIFNIYFIASFQETRVKASFQLKLSPHKIVIFPIFCTLPLQFFSQKTCFDQNDKFSTPAMLHPRVGLPCLTPHLVWSLSRAILTCFFFII